MAGTEFRKGWQQGDAGLQCHRDESQLPGPVSYSHYRPRAAAGIWMLKVGLGLVICDIRPATTNDS